MGTTSKRTDDERPRRIRKFDSPATPVAAEPQSRRARKRRSHEKFGNIVSLFFDKSEIRQIGHLEISFNYISLGKFFCLCACVTDRMCVYDL